MLELTDDTELIAKLELLSALVAAELLLSADDVCGLVLVVVLAVKPLLLLSPAPPPPPQALRSNITATPSKLMSLEE